MREAEARSCSQLTSGLTLRDSRDMQDCGVSRLDLELVLDFQELASSHVLLFQGVTFD